MARTSAQHAPRRSPTVTALTAAVLVLSAATALPAAAAVTPGALWDSAVPAAAALPVPAAAADPVADGIAFEPRRVPAGAGTELRVAFCGDDTSALASSVAFEHDVRLAPGPDAGAGGRVLSGTAVVSADAEPGTYAVTVDCEVDTGIAEGSFIVLPGQEQQPNHRADRRNDRHTAPASPVAPVRAGGGGTADGTPAGAGADAAPGTPVLALAGVAVVLGAAVWAVRGRRTTGPDGW